MLRYLAIAGLWKVLAAAACTAAAPCSTYTIINTRGTSEPQTESLGFQLMNRNIHSQRPGGKTYNTVYFADTVHSPKIGTEDILNHMNSTLASSPDECFILQGYSQGASATVGALPYLTGALFDAVKGVFLIGNPFHKAALACNVDINGGSSTADVDGAFVFLDTTLAVPDDWVSKTLDVCNFGDGVCDSTHGKGITVEHYDYITNLSVQGMGAGFALRQLSKAAEGCK
ncbi:uncharacterized protein LMH87_008637 [Akanthomyces muscarius]|uniref:Cutinase n=1 Tax=Akanthomyces muscarius TaxID=2231603 RepID=A0A9W8UPU8_AKAMU|nr:uncharacterized protein LMH87_008637 [Akanthomyces muscarius]KAJ4158093.1 hypothetical protein LMH87_008637 [Akanthomyces muscarius]